MAAIHKRRTAEEWRRIVTAWEESGVSAGEFARRRGFSANTLSWWRWRLRKEPELRLVRAEIVDDDGWEDDGLIWELRTETGHLRVSGDRALRGLALALAGLGAAVEER